MKIILTRVLVLSRTQSFKKYLAFCVALLVLQSAFAQDYQAPPGNGLDFDGVNDYVTVPGTAIGNTIGQVKDYTISFWMRTTTAGSTGPASIWQYGTGIVDAAQAGGVTNDFGVSLLGDKICAGFGNTDAGTDFNIVSKTSVTTGKWVYVAVVRNTTNTPNSFSIYINGVLDVTAPITATTLNNYGFTIGANNTRTHYFKGTLDEIKMSGFAYGAQQVAYMMRYPGYESHNAFALFHCNQGTAGGGNTSQTVLTNDGNYTSASNYPGTLSGFSLSGATSNFVESFAYLVPDFTSAANITGTGFTIGWSMAYDDYLDDFTDYLLDVSTSSTFSSFAGAYHDFSIDNTATAGHPQNLTLTALNNSTKYYYRVRANKKNDAVVAGSGAYSVIDSTTTLAVPSITSAAPLIASRGTNVAISGSGFANATAVSFGGTAAYSYTIVSDNLINAIVGDGASGNVSVTSVAGAGTTAGFIYRATGTPGNGLAFDGTDDYFTIANPLASTTGGYTIEFWMRTTQTGAKLGNGTQWHNGTGIIDGDISIADKNDYGISLIGSKLGFGWGKSGSADQTVISTSDVNTGKWVHVAIVTNSTATSIYLNGVLNASGAANTATMPDGPSTLKIGGNNNNTFYFNGTLDELRFFSGNRTSSLLTDMRAGIAASTTGLLSYYTFDEGNPGNTNTGVNYALDSKKSSAETLQNFAMSGTTSNWVYSYAMVIPVAVTATNMAPTGFRANWQAPSPAPSHYYLEVSTSATFASFVTGYDGSVELSTATSLDVTGLAANTTYYYRVRSSNDSYTGQSGTSNVISVTTPANNIITGFSPAAGATGATITISGSGFTSASAVTFGGVPSANFSVVSDTRIDATVGAGATGQVSVTAPGGTTTAGGTFTWLPPPAITNFLPRSAGVGIRDTIYGTNFTNITNVTIGGTTPTYTVINSTTIVFTVSANTNGAITVTGRDGSSTFGTSFTLMQHPGNALNFDGTNDYVRIKNPLTGDFTIEFWFNPAQAGVTNGFGKWYEGTGLVDGEISGTVHDLGVGLWGNHVAFGTGDPANNTDRSITSATAITNGVWYHVAAVRNKSAGTLQLYINGRLDASGTASIENISGVDSLTIGAVNNISSFFKGSIDEVRLYNSALTQAAIQADMVTNTGASNGSNVAAYYTFDETGIITLLDASGNSNTTGKLYNFANTGNTSNWVPSYATIVPVVTATSHTALFGAGFTANWAAPANTNLTVNNYVLDVATDGAFSALVVNARSVTGTTSVVTGLSPNTKYYYRVRANNTATGLAGTGAYSRTDTLTTYNYLQSFSPASAGTGVTVTLKGYQLTGATAVSFGGMAAQSFSVVSDSVITATVAAGTGATGVISVTTTGGVRTISGFTYLNPPGNALTFTNTSSPVLIDMGAKSITGNYTVEVWVKPANNVNTTGTIFSARGDGGGAGEYTFDMKFGSTGSGYGITVDIGTGTTWMANAVGANYTFDANTWYHIACVVTNTNYSIYIDGVLLKQANYSGGTNTSILCDGNTRKQFRLGAGVTGDAAFIGDMDEVRVYSTALSQASIQADRLSTATQGNIECYYNFDQSPLTTVYDIKNGHNGTSSTTAFNSSYAMVVPVTGTASSTATGITVNWLAPSFGSASSYKVYIATDAAFANIISTQTITGTTASLAGLSQNTTYYYRVRAVGGGLSNVSSITTGNLPVVSGVSPVTAPAGTTVTISGSYFAAPATVQLGTVTGIPVTVVNAGSATFTVPANAAATGALVLTTPNGASTGTINFTYLPAPVITSFSPSSGGPGTVVTINGSNFNGLGATQYALTGVSFNGVKSASFTITSDNIISATVGPNSTTGVISVTSPAGSGSSSSNFTFSGLAAPGKALSLSNASSKVLSVNTGTTTVQGSFTVEAWVKPATTTGTMCIFSTRQAGGTFDMKLENNTMKADIGTATGFLNINAVAAFKYVANRWYHVAYTVTPAGYTAYINGVVAATGNNGFDNINIPVLLNSSHNIISIGTATGTDELFGGNIDEVKVWGTARTAAEIKADMINIVSSPLSQSSLAAYFNFDETSGTNVYDLSANGFIGTYSFTKDPSFATVVPVITTPVINGTDFTATWTAPLAGSFDNYVLDVATDANFTSFVSGYNGATVAKTETSKAVTGLAQGTAYYYRIRANSSSFDNQGAYWSDNVTTTQYLPVIKLFTPANALAGATITIKGSNFSHITNVSIGGITATYNLVDSTSITAIVPANSSGNITVTTTGGTATKGSFTCGNPPAYALAFDGTDDNISIPAVVLDNLSTGTYETWLYLNDNTKGTIVAKQSNGVATASVFSIGSYSSSGGRPTTGTAGQVYFRAQNSSPLLASKTILQTGHWYHIAVAFSNTSASVYINGRLDSTVAGNFTVPTVTSGNILTSIGAWLGDGTGQYLNGRLDELRIWNVVRTAAQIDSGYLKTAISSSTGLLAYYNFDGGLPAGNTTAYDISANMNNGTLTGFALTGTTSNWVESYAMVVPKANTGTLNTGVSFTANWSAPVTGTVDNNYLLDVATDSLFATNLTQYTGVAGTSKSITGLNPGTVYYYRVRADKSTVTGQGGYSNTIADTTLSLPFITSFTPASAGYLDTVRIKGTSFTGTTAVKFGGTAASSIVAVTDTTITAIVATGTTGNILITAAGGTNAGTGTFTYLQPTITSFSPLSAGYLDTVIIKGTKLKTTTAVTIGGTAASSIVTKTDTTLTVIVAAGTTGNIAITATSGSATSAAAFTYLQPTITSFSPLSAGYLDTVIIKGTKLKTTTAVTFGGTSASSIVTKTDTTLTVIVAAGTTGNIAINATSGTAISTGNFTFLAPSITSFTPASAGIFDTVTITGAGLRGTTAVSFGGTAAAKVVAAGTTVKAVVSNGTSGAVSLTGPGGTVTLPGFTFNQATTSLTAPGNALSFNGSSNYVSIPAGTTSVSGSYTVEAWVKPMNTSATMNIFSTRSAGGDFTFDMALRSGNKIHADIGTGSQFLNIAADATYTYTAGRWYHIAYVVTPAGYSIYANDSLIINGTGGFDNVKVPLLFNATHNIITIGGNGASELFNGNIDEVKVWNTARNKAQIGADMLTAATNPAGTANLVAYYNFDEGSAGGTNTAINQLIDAGSNNLTGNLVNFGLSGSTGNWVESYAMIAPMATAATAVMDSSFTANWQAPVTGTVDSFKVTVAKDMAFTQIVPGCDSVKVEGTGTSLAITGLIPNTTYYYRVRAHKASVKGQGAYSNTISVTTTIPPVVTSFTPDSAVANTAVSITGSHFTGVTAVSFGATPALNYTVLSDVLIKATVNTGTTGNVSVTGINGVTASLAGFVYVGAPVITSFTPQSAAAFDTVIITGSNLGSVRTVSFGGIAANAIVSKSQDTVIVVVAGGATGDVTVTTLAGTAAKTGFIYAAKTPPGNALALDGSDDHITIPNTPALNPSTITVEAWINPATTADGYIIAKPNSRGPSGAFFEDYFIIISGGKFRAVMSNNGTQKTANGISAFKTGKWYHVAAVFSAAQVSLYINGVLQESTATGFALDHSANPVIIGANPNMGVHTPFSIDGLTIWNTARTQAEIAADMLTPISNPGANTNIVAYYDFDEGNSGGTNTGINLLYDRSANNITAALSAGFALTGNVGNWIESYAMAVPAANTALNTGSSFVASWAAPKVGIVNNYLLDVATDSTFTNLVSGYNALPVADTFATVSHLLPLTTYYYRVSANKSSVTGQGGYSNRVTVATPAFASITSFTPASAGTNNTITITGTNTNFATGVSFGGVPAASFTIVNSTTITAVVANGASGKVYLTSATATDSLAGFTYVGTPSITSFAPQTAAIGDTVTIRGTLLAGAAAVRFGGKLAAAIVSNSDTAITVLVGPAATGNVSVTTTGGTASAAGFVFTAPAPPGNALNFNGTGNYVSVPVGNAAVSGSFTVEAWVRPLSSSGTMNVFSTRLGGEYTFDVALRNGNTLHADIGDGNSFFNTTANATFNYTAGQWYHIAYVVTPAGYSIYANDSLLATGNAGFSGVTPLLFNSSHSNISIGSSNGTTEFFNGNIDEVKVWNTARTQAQISSDMLNIPASPAADATLAAYFNFDNGIAGAANSAFNRLYDFSGNNFIGTLNNFGLTGSTGNWVESYAMVVPAVLPATNILDNGFTAAWNIPSIGMVDSFKVFVATDSAFVNIVPGYNGANVAGTQTTLNITGLITGTVYYYRVRAHKSSVTGQGVYSGSAKAITTTPPVITSFTPVTAGVNAQVVIKGKTFTGVTAVSFGNIAAASYTVVSDTIITALVSTGATGSVAVTGADGVTVSMAGFNFVEAPVITSFTPSSASPATFDTITITGANFTGIQSVTFGGTPATAFVVTSATTIKATAGNGKSGDVVVTGIGGTASKSGFTYTSATPPGNALNFNGSNYVSVPIGSASVTGTYTVEAWARPANNNTNTIFSTRKVGDQTFDMKLSGGNLIHGDIGDGGGVGKVGFMNTNADANFNYTAGTWYHISYVVTPAGYSIYVNDSLIKTGGTGFDGVKTPLLFNSTHSIITIGGDGSTEFFNGDIDEVKVWKTARTKAQIGGDMYNVMSNPSADGSLVAYYSFDEGIAGGTNTGINLLFDQSANNFTGNLVNFALTGNSGNWVESYAMVTPFALAAGTAATGFIANFTAPSTGTAENYLLDIATNAAFTNFVTGYNALSVTGSPVTINGLLPSANYWYRVRANKSSVNNQGAYSNIISVTTPAFAHITSFSPAVATTNDIVSIKGVNLTNVTGVSFGGVPAAAFTATDSAILATVGAGASGNVATTSAAGIDSLPGFTYYGAPVISFFTPASAGIGEQVSIHGSYLSTTTAVSFGGVPAAGFTVSDTLITATIGNGASGAISVTAKGGTATTAGFVFARKTPPGNALNFNGGNYVSIPAGSVTVAGSYTVEAWARPANGYGNNTIFSTRSAGGDNTFDMKFDGNNRLHADIGTGDQFLNTAADAIYPYTAGHWYHITYVVTPAGYSIYVNGKLITRGNDGFDSTSIPLLLNSTHNVITIGSNGTGEYFSGDIDEVKVWNTARTQEQIAADMVEVMANPAADASLVAYYGFDEGIAGGTNTAVTSLYDGSANNLTGTLNSFTLAGNSSNWVESFAMVIPASLTISNVTTTGFTAHWENPVINGADSYKVTVTGPGYSNTFVTTNTVQVVTGLMPGSSYICTVSAEKVPFTGQGAPALSDTINTAGIKNFNPKTATTGDTITITGTGFTGVSAVSFGGVPAASYTIIGSSTIKAIVGAGAIGEVSVTIPLGNAGKAGFIYYGAGSITSFAPATAGSFDTVFIKGISFTTATAVKFGGSPAYSFTVLSDSSIRAIVGGGATGNVSVTTRAGTCMLNGFTYSNVTPPPPGNALNFANYEYFYNKADVKAVVADNYTIETWVMPSAGNDYQGIFYTGTMMLQMATGQSIQVDNYDAVTNDEYWADIPFNYTPGKWYHIAYAVTPAGYTLYVNGKVIGSGSFNPGATTLVFDNAYNNYIQLGRSWYSNLKGNLDEFKIWNATRTQEQIQADMRNVKSGPALDSTLALYYDFEQGTPGGDNQRFNVLFDRSANGITARLDGFGLTGSESNFVESYAMVVPTAKQATGIKKTAFTARWAAPAVGIAENYKIAVASDSAFTNIINSYDSVNVAGSDTAYSITGLDSSTTYYYRVWADKSSVPGQGAYSNTIAVTTAAVDSVNSTTLITVCANALPYHWNGQDYIAAGIYTVHLTGIGGADSAAILVLSVANNPVATIKVASGNNTVCYGNSKKLLITATGGTKPYMYSIDAATYQAERYFLVPAGNYKVTVRDSNGCYATTNNINITQPPTPLTVTQLDISTGSINVAAAGGFGNYTYSLNGSAYQSSGAFTNIAPGLQIITVKDGEGCTVIKRGYTLSAVLTAQSDTAVCYGGTASLKVIATKGTAPYQYSIDGGNTFQASNYFKVPAGNYTVMVRDASGNYTYSNKATITQAQELSLSTSKVAVTCNASGSVTINATGGFGSYLYSLNGSSFQAGNTFAVDNTGLYSITVKDSAGCIAKGSVTFAPWSATLASSATQICYGKLATFTVLARNGRAPYSYSFDGGLTFQDSAKAKLPAGTYSAVVKDATGCTAATNTIVVSQPAMPLMPAITQTDVLCKGGNDGSIKVTASGGYATAYTYAINNTYQAQNVFNGLVAGSYIIAVKDAFGCIESTRVLIKQPAEPCSSLTAPVNTTSSKAALPDELKIKVYPNPTITDFNLQVITGDRRNVVEIRVMDMNGKTIYQNRGSVLDMFKFGRAFASGMYIAEVINGNNIQRVKLVKGN